MVHGSTAVTCDEVSDAARREAPAAEGSRTNGAAMSVERQPVERLVERLVEIATEDEASGDDVATVASASDMRVGVISYMLLTG